MSDLVVSLDGTDVSGVAIEGSATRRLNRPAQATIKIPMEQAIGGPGSKLQISFDAGGTLFHHGTVLDCETDTGEDTGYTVYNSSDPMELWQWRPVRDDDGDFSKPEIITTYITGPEIMEAVLKNTEGDSTAQGNPLLTPPSAAEGPTFLDFGSFATGGPPLLGAPTDWPMTIMEFANLLISTGCLDLVITPSDPGGGVMGTIDGYNGNFGTDLSASVTFSYGMGTRNVRRIRWNEDMTNLCNKLWYYAGPRCGTISDPAGDQHWCFNVTGDDPDLCGNTGTPTCLDKDGNVTHGIGGALPTSIFYDGGVLGDMRDASQTSDGPGGTGYGVRMDIQIFDAFDDNCCDNQAGTPGRDLYRRLWQEESWIRLAPRNLVHVTPIRGIPLGTFDIGDLVTVEAGSMVRGGFSGAQRVYGYTVSWDADGPFELSELQTSDEQGS